MEEGGERGGDEGTGGDAKVGRGLWGHGVGCDFTAAWRLGVQLIWEGNLVEKEVGVCLSISLTGGQKEASTYVSKVLLSPIYTPSKCTHKTTYPSIYPKAVYNMCIMPNSSTQFMQSRRRHILPIQPHTHKRPGKPLHSPT